MIYLKKKLYIVLFLILFIGAHYTYFDLLFVNLSIESKLWPAAYTFYITVNNIKLEKISIVIISHFDENTGYFITFLLYRIIIYLYTFCINFILSNKKILLILICNIIFSCFFFWIIFCLKNYLSFYAFNVFELQIKYYYDFFSFENNLVNYYFLIVFSTCFVLFITCLDNFVYSIIILYLLFYNFNTVIIKMCCMYPITISSIFVSHLCVFYIYFYYIDNIRLSLKTSSNFNKNDLLHYIEYFRIYLKDFTLTLIFTICLYYVVTQNEDFIRYQFFMNIDPINYLISIKSYCTSSSIEIAQYLNDKIAALEKDYLLYYLDQVKPLQQLMFVIFLFIFFLIDFIFYLLEKMIIKLICFYFFTIKNYKKY